MERIDWGHDALNAENLADEWRSLAMQERKRAEMWKHVADKRGADYEFVSHHLHALQQWTRARHGY